MSNFKELSVIAGFMVLFFTGIASVLFSQYWLFSTIAGFGLALGTGLAMITFPLAFGAFGDRA